jgi:predicted nucleotidyltransferase
MRAETSSELFHSYLQRAVRALAAYEPERVIVFGSYARGDFDAYSDLDLVIIKETDRRFVERLVEAGSYLDLPISVDVFVYTPAEFQSMVEEGNPFIERVQREGRVIYERSSNSKKMDGPGAA